MAPTLIANLIGASSGVISGAFICSFLKNKTTKVFAEEKVEPLKLPWGHSGWFSSYDHARYI